MNFSPTLQTTKCTLSELFWWRKKKITLFLIEIMITSFQKLKENVSPRYLENVGIWLYLSLPNILYLFFGLIRKIFCKYFHADRPISLAFNFLRSFFFSSDSQRSLVSSSDIVKDFHFSGVSCDNSTIFLIHFPICVPVPYFFQNIVYFPRLSYAPW